MCPGLTRTNEVILELSFVYDHKVLFPFCLFFKSSIIIQVNEE